MNDQELKDTVATILGRVLRELGADAARAAGPAAAVENGPIPVELSARHVHLSEHDVQALFGKPLTHRRDLSQPGQFACNERVRLIGPKGVIDNVSVLGPARSKTQIEVSKTDARALGIDAPVRESGDIAGTPGIILATPKGIIGVEEGVIVAARHIHMTPEDAARLGVSDKEKVSVRLATPDRTLVMEKVVVRVSPKFRLAMHIDTDEGNAAGNLKGVTGVIVARAGD